MIRFLGVCVLALSATIASSAMQPPTIAVDAVYQAIRANDIGRLRSLVHTAGDANQKDAAGVPLLMTSAAVGSVEAMTLLLDKGADVNARNGFGATALIWAATDLAKVQLLTSRGADVNLASKTGRTALFVAAMSEPSASIVRHLVSKGARLEARDAFQNTALTAATMGNDLDTIRLMVAAGIDVNAAGVTGVTPLLGAAYHGNAAAVKLLLEKGARTSVVAAAPVLFPPESPKSGPVALTEVTPLMIAAARETPEVVKMLLDAGAPVNAKDGRGMTPLMFAIAKSRQQPAVIRMLIERGADPGVQSSAGEAAADWARKVGAAPALEILKVARTENAPAAVATAPAISAKTAAERSVALLETSSRKFFETSGCVSCHHQNITDMAVGEARARGVSTSTEHAIERLKMLSAGPPPELLYERMDIGVPEIFAASLTALAAVDVPANPAIDALVSEIAATQAADGSWHLTGGINERPPAEEGAITRTALCVRSLKVYGPPGRVAEMKARLERAWQWLLAATPVTSEDQNMRLLGLHWAGTDTPTLKRLAVPILAAQRADGGWRQHEASASDAYATGQSLYVLSKTGALAPGDAAYARGVTYLLTTQNANGSWRVASRAPKFQAYFNSGFPYAGDQWISAWATGWAAMALAQTVPATTGRPIAER
jgi:ankyrin repeat protein